MKTFYFRKNITADINAPASISIKEDKLSHHENNANKESKKREVFLRILLLFLLCLAPIPLNAQVPASNPQADAYRAHAQELLTKSDFPGAITEYQKAYDLDKTGPTLYVAFDLFNIGSLYYSSDQYVKSIEAYQQSIPLWQQLGDKPSEAKALNNIGLDYQTLHQYDKALASYQLALPLERQNTNKTIPDKTNEAASLHNMGEIYLELHQYDKALEFFQQALPLWQQLGDTTSEATTLSDAGLANAYLSQYDKALEFYQQALPLWQKQGNSENEASTLNKIGLVYDKQSQYEKALTSYQQALTIIQQVGDIKDEADTLNNIGAVYQKINQNAKALDLFQKTLLLSQRIGDKERQANTLNKIGETYDDLNQSNKALVYYAQALTLYQQIGDRNGEATAILNTGYAYDSLSQYTKALDYENKALKIFQHLGNKSSEANAFLNLGVTSVNLSQYHQALDHYNQALTIFQKLGDKANAARALHNIGNVYNYLGQHVKELDFYNQALTIEQLIVDKASEAMTLSSIGSNYYYQEQYSKALLFFMQALSLEQMTGNKTGEAIMLKNLGLTYDKLNLYENARKVYLEALSIEQKMGDKAIDATLLNNIGLVYDKLSQYDQAWKFYKWALKQSKVTGNQSSEATALSYLGITAVQLKHYYAAITYFHQALTIVYPYRKHRNNNDYRVIMEAVNSTSIMQGTIISYTSDNKNNHYIKQSNNTLSNQRFIASFYSQQAKDIQSEIIDQVDPAAIYNNLGGVYHKLKQYAKSITYYQQALRIAKQSKNINEEVAILNYTGNIHYDNGKYDQAISNYQQALSINRTEGGIQSVGVSLSGLMITYQSKKQLSLAIFYGKKAIIIFQQIRGIVNILGKEALADYLKTKQSTYRTLADLLIQQGRLPEAEAVLALLKEAEYRDFNGTNRSIIERPNAPVPLTTKETHWQADYDTLGDTIDNLNKKVTELAKLDTRTANQEIQYRTLVAKLDKAKAAFKEFLDSLPKHFIDVRKGYSTITAIKQTQKMQNALTRWSKAGTRVAILYTVEADTQYAVILVTPNGSRPGVTSISAAKLNKKIEVFRQALTDRCVDPRPLGQELYKILVGPIEKDLKAYDPQVIMWSLDGLIRYLPVAALYNGKEYLVEYCQNTLYDPASVIDLEQSRTNWQKAQALGLGVSMKHHIKTSSRYDDFPALPYVPEELDSIIHDPQQAGALGVLTGQVRLDNRFTRIDTMNALRAHTHLVVHIATHFHFDATQAEQSYLLLGDGGQISIADLNNRGLFQGVELLTLSACSTAMGQANADGREVDSLGNTAENEGAQSVIASLWNVSDASTAHLMEILYRNLQQSPSITKAAALQAAQLALLHGTATLNNTDKHDITNKRGIELASENPNINLPRFKTDPNKPYAHPFYWAPFVLIGNWR